MASVNKAIVLGNLGRDAEMRYTPGGHAVCTFSLATTDVWTDKSGQKQERTEWHRVTLWGKVAEALTTYLTKGKSVYVEGSLQTRKWTDKNGVERYTTQIRGDKVVLLGGGQRRESAPTEDVDRSDSNEPAAAPLADDDIPF